MKRFEFEGNRLTLHVKKTPIVIRAILFAFGFMAGVLPLAGMIAALASGRDFHFGYLFGVFFTGLMGVYMIRIALWNSLGFELIQLKDDRLDYIADYGWFKDGKKSISMKGLKASFLLIGYEEEGLAVLQIANETQSIESVVKLPIDDLTEIAQKLNQSFNFRGNEP